MPLERRCSFTAVLRSIGRPLLLMSAAGCEDSISLCRDRQSSNGGEGDRTSANRAKTSRGNRAMAIDHDVAPRML
jgi:hypothetical protein